MSGGVENLKKGEFQQRVRRINGMLIHWVAKDMIIVNTKNMGSVKFDNFFPSKGDYAKKWKPFMDYLRTYNEIPDIWAIMSKASSLEISMSSNTRVHQIAPDAVVYPTKHDWSKKK